MEKRRNNSYYVYANVRAKEKHVLQNNEGI